MIIEFARKLSFWIRTDRIGPDIPATHWQLHLHSTMLRLCQKKFGHFSATADFRPGAYAICCSKISIGQRVVIRPGCMLFADPRPGGAGITIEDDVMLGSGVHVYVHNHRFDDPSRPIIDQGHLPSQAVILRRGSWIGANSIVLPGVTVGANAVVGAGAVVTKDVPARVVAVGNPARILREIGSEITTA